MYGSEGHVEAGEMVSVAIDEMGKWVGTGAGDRNHQVTV